MYGEADESLDEPDRQPGRPRPLSGYRQLLVGLVMGALIGAGVFAAIDSSNDTNPPAGNNAPFSGAAIASGLSGPPPVAVGNVRLTNNLGRPVRVAYCPQRNCTGQGLQTMQPNTWATFRTYATKDFPDSYVVLDGTNKPACEKVGVNPAGGSGDAYGYGVGNAWGDGSSGNDIRLSGAIPSVCDLDIATLAIPR